MTQPDNNSTGITTLDHIFEGAGFSLSRSGRVSVAPDVTDEDLTRASINLVNFHDQTKQLTKLVAVAVGSLILEHAARHQCSIPQAVDVMGLTKDYDYAERTFFKWARIAGALPDHVLCLPGLHLSHLDSAVSFGGPSTPAAMRKFNEDRDSILKEISENPEGKGKRYLNEQMRGLKDRHGAPRQRPEAKDRLLAKLVQCLRLARLTPDVRQAYLKRHDSDDADLSGQIRSLEDQLTERKVIPVEILETAPHWK